MTDENKQTSSPASQADAQPGMQAKGEDAPVDNLLGLKLLVVSMGVLLVVAAITFVILLVLKSNEPDEAEGGGPAQVASTTVAGDDVPLVRLRLQPEEEVVDMMLDGRSLALHLKSSRGERILIIDPYTSDHRSVIEIDRD